MFLGAAELAGGLGVAFGVLTQLVVLALSVALAIVAAIRFRVEPVRTTARTA